MCLQLLVNNSFHGKRIMFFFLQRFEIYRPPDGMWGVELPNGSWNGMLGMIQRQVMLERIRPL